MDRLHRPGGDDDAARAPMPRKAPKEFEPDDPMELVGVELPGGDVDATLDGLVNEYLMLGYTGAQIRWLFKSPYYGVTNDIWRQKGDGYVEQRIKALADRWAQGWVDDREPGPA